MELVLAAAGGESTDSRSVTISPADRRLLGIKTVAARRSAVLRTLRGVGVLSVNEAKVARIPAYTGGRIEQLGVNFTGQSVQVGDRLVTMYSPDLYAAQTELLALKQTRRGTNRNGLTDVRAELVTAARQRLVELGMTRGQISAMEDRGTADTRVMVTSPQAGTVTRLLARVGQYVQTGDLLCEMADLSSVWLMTDLFPEEAALVRYGQRARATVTSLPGQEFQGRVAFIAPTVNPETRTVGVRIEISNAERALRPGDEATVHLSVPALRRTKMYDRQLAGKWICPEHPEVVRASAGICPQSERELIQTVDLGYARAEDEVERPIVLPREAILMTGDVAAAFVEAEPGRFEIRQVTLGAKLTQEVVVVAGIEEGEQVATGGNFLIDSQMQLAGNPSLIDLSRVVATAESQFEITPPPIGPIRADTPSSGPSPQALPAPPTPPAEDEWQLPPITAPVPAPSVTDGTGTESQP